METFLHRRGQRWGAEEGNSRGDGSGVIYNAFLRANYFFVSADSGFGRGGFYKRVVGQGDVFHRDKVTSECGGGQLTQFWDYG
jgi:hypothetical protein